MHHACVGRDQHLCCLLFPPRHQHVCAFYCGNWLVWSHCWIFYYIQQLCLICIATPYVTLVHFKWNILGSLLICCNQCDLVQFTQCPQLVEADQWRGIHHGPGNQSSSASCLTIPSSLAIISGAEDGRLCVGSLPVCHDSWWVTRVGSVEPGSQYDAGASIVMPVFGWNWNSQFPASNQSDCQILGVTNSIWPRKKKIFLLHLWHSQCQRHNLLWTGFTVRNHYAYIYISSQYNNPWV